MEVQETERRNIALELHDQIGQVLPALLWHFEHYTTQTQVRINFKHSGLERRRFGSDVETAAYRRVQEALTNIARHAQVPEAMVRLSTYQQTLLIEVEDSGRGFDVEAVLSASETSDLAGMRERAVLLGGKLNIESDRDGGTRLTAEVSLHERL